MFCDPVSDFYRDLSGSFYTICVQVCSVQDQMVYPFRVSDCKYHCDVAAIRKSEQIGSFNVVLVHKVKEIVRKLAYSKGFVSSRSFAVSPCIQGIYLILFSKHVQLVFKIGAVFSIAMKQNDRIPLSLFNIEMFVIQMLTLKRIMK